MMMASGLGPLGAIMIRITQRGFSGFALVVLCAAVFLAASPSRGADITVFAAASLTDALEEIGAKYAGETGETVRFSFASSSVLARQIEAGAPAQIFAAASELWMDYLVERNLIDVSTRVSLLGNSLVLVAPADSAIDSVEIAPGLDLAALLGPQDRIAIGDPAHTPAGIYAKQALERLGAWDPLERRVAVSENVRAALALVERGEAPLGIVYATDTAFSGSVKVIGHFPASSHDPITYPVAVVAGETTVPVMQFFEYLTGRQGLEVFERHGFARN